MPVDYVTVPADVLALSDGASPSAGTILTEKLVIFPAKDILLSIIPCHIYIADGVNQDVQRDIAKSCGTDSTVSKVLSQTFLFLTISRLGYVWILPAEESKSNTSLKHNDTSPVWVCIQKSNYKTLG